MKNEKRIVICPVGLNGSGKGNVCRILVENHGFIFLSTSDVIRSVVKEHGLECTRTNMGQVANLTRTEHGKEYFASYLSATMDISAHSYVVDGCRQVEEIEFLKNKYPGLVYVVKVFCDPRVRFDRMKVRNRTGDPSTFEEFLNADEIELGNVIAVNTMNYKACFELAMQQVDNSGSVGELERNVEALLAELYLS
ncbi:MAG: AAA family ATPase [bacterium]|nr:AAA family ATPase [bacterium]